MQEEHRQTISRFDSRRSKIFLDIIKMRELQCYEISVIYATASQCNCERKSAIAYTCVLEDKFLSRDMMDDVAEGSSSD